MFRILVVCVGNICRSPMAVALLRRELTGKDVSIESAGLASMAGDPIHPAAAKALDMHGLSMHAHVAAQVDPGRIERADMILAMEKRHVSAILAMYPEARKKTFLFGKWEGDAEVADPYGRGDEAFSVALDTMRAAARSWKDRIP